MYVEQHTVLSQTLSIMTKDSWPGRITGNAWKTQFPHLPWMKNSIFQSLLRVHQTPQGVMRSLEKAWSKITIGLFFLSPYIIYSEISKNIKRGHKIVLMCIRRGCKFERLRHPTNVSASAGGTLPTPLCPQKECRRGELGFPFLAVLLARVTNSPPAARENHFHLPHFLWSL